MIQTKKELKEYLLADKKAGHYEHFYCHFDIVWRYVKRLRKTAYYQNTNKRIRYLISQVILSRLSVQTGLSIGVNSFGKGLYIPHHGCIVVNGYSRLGDNCVVQCGVNISEKVEAGDHCYFGAGCKLIRGAKVGNDVIIGANAVVTKQFTENNIVLAGVPAKIISTNGFMDNLDI